MPRPHMQPTSISNEELWLKQLWLIFANVVNGGLGNFHRLSIGGEVQWSCGYSDLSIARALSQQISVQF